MKFILILLFAFSAHAAQDGAFIKKIKEMRGEPMSFTCTSPGYSCQSSGDCCGASMCNSGFCSSPGVGDVGPGGACQSSGDCAGASMCQSGFCSDPGVGNVPVGGHCSNSGDCQGASFCRDGICN